MDRGFIPAGIRGQMELPALVSFERYALRPGNLGRNCRLAEGRPVTKETVAQWKGTVQEQGDALATVRGPCCVGRGGFRRSWGMGYVTTYVVAGIDILALAAIEGE